MPRQGTTLRSKEPPQPTAVRAEEPGGTTVLVASRRGLVQIGMTSLLGQLPQFRQVGTACDPDALVRTIDQHRPDVLVLDEELANDVRGDSRPRHPPRVLVLSATPHMAFNPPCGEDCACGLVSDRAPARHIRAALKIIGGCRSTRLGDGYCASCPLRASLRRPPLPLSERELAVLTRIGLGESNQQMAAAFGRSVKTIETHRENIKRKLGLESGAALVQAAGAWLRGDAVLPAGAPRTVAVAPPPARERRRPRR